MCGIAGLLARGDGSYLVGRMLHAQAHRGPDGEGLWSEAVAGARSLVLGHKRLAILDLTQAGSQPMVDTTGKFVVTYNGEIYNYLEVRARLMRGGVIFRSQSDTEVLLEAYKHWGESCLAHLNGMFAFVIFDRSAGKLFCARDRYGEKPFLYAIQPDFFAFASEYKGLLQHPSVSMEIDEWRLMRAAHHGGNGLDGDRDTVFRGVQQLLPGEAMSVDTRTLNTRIWRYWTLSPAVPEVLASEGALTEEFRELLIDAVRIRLRSDVAVGSCLSGGLDSSSIVCIVRHLMGEGGPSYHTFTGRFPGTPADEWEYAQQITSAPGIVSHVTVPTVDRFLDELGEFIWANELPVGSASQYAQWSVFALAKQMGVTVLLDGQGADETLAGYEQYFGFYLDSLRERGDLERLARELPDIRERYSGTLASPVRRLRDRIPFKARHWLSRNFGAGTSLLYGIRSDQVARLVSDNALKVEPGFHALANVLAQDTFRRSLTTLLRYGDRNSMAHSREVRLPFCDHRIAEFVGRLPPAVLMGEAQTKRLLRESMKGILPEPIRTRWRKQGFRPPQDLWFKSPRLVGVVREMFYSPEFAGHSFWIAGWWQDALARLETGESELAWVIWQPFIIQAWKQYFLMPMEASRRMNVQALQAAPA